MQEIIKKFPDEIVLKSQKIKAIIVKLEGVLTKATVQFNGESSIYSFNLLDDNIIKPLRENGIILIAITHNESNVFKNKVKQLSYDEYKPINSKITNLISDVSNEFGILPEEICVIGYDLLDLPYIKQAGLGVCPNDSVEYIQSYSDLTANAKSGEGVLREIADLVLASQNKLKNVINVD